MDGTGPDDSVKHHWLPRSPDLSDFFLWGFIKDYFYVPPLPAILTELKIRMIAAVEAVDADCLQKFGMNLTAYRNMPCIQRWAY
ncbi:hypothetical protein AVEN_20841-1 [Araneus ventricosus]|uniref:Uncharacterized protein n=1 Tax=Araneus ventricosus TaxID=182803 RepID=A0A4Y2MFF0_ARAVE|nr:hypothetical protein AVEN_20841-1 [Araneus ventricosus]